MEIILENIRCFSGKHNICSTPLTILVGENSTGKSTFLSALSLLSNEKRFPLRPAFNQAPFELGDYYSIATKKRGGGHADYFAIGFKKKVKKNNISVKATYHERDGHVCLKAFELASNTGHINIQNTEPVNMVAFIKDKKKHKKYEIRVKGPYNQMLETSGLKTVFASSFLPMMMKEIEDKINQNKNQREADSLERLEQVRICISGIADLLEQLIPFEDSPLAIAPIRSKPHRTYDTFSDEFDPEGSHIPLRLVRIQERRGKTFSNLSNALKKFGRDSGLFNDIIIQKLGKRPSSAFQVIVRTGKRQINIIDVGYGVSQCLPIIVQSVMSDIEKPILLQQPEVHLHPKAQAALGSLFIDLVSKNNKTIFVETHSDYLIDRIRTDIANKKIDPSIVSILYFERPQSRSKVYEIRLDENGNIKNAPSSYRRFFLDEEHALLARGD